MDAADALLGDPSVEAIVGETSPFEGLARPALGTTAGQRSAKRRACTSDVVPSLSVSLPELSAEDYYDQHRNIDALFDRTHGCVTSAHPCDIVHGPKLHTHPYEAVPGNRHMDWEYVSARLRRDRATGYRLRRRDAAGRDATRSRVPADDGSVVGMRLDRARCVTWWVPLKRERLARWLVRR